MLRDSLRSVGVLARIGGDEFVVILPETALAEATSIAHRLCRAVRSQGRVDRGGEHARVTASVGITELDECAGEDLTRIVMEADAAMYRAKAAGRDGVRVYAPGAAGLSEGRSRS